MKSPESNSGQNPNVLQSSSLNEEGSGTFARTTTTTPATLPGTSVRREAPAEMPIVPPRKRLYQKLDNLLSNLLGSRKLRIGLAVGVGATVVVGLAGYEAYQNVPPVHQSIDNAYLDIMRTIGIETVVPPTFDTKAGRTKFGENNITRITAEEAESKKLLEPTIKVDNTNTVTVTTLLPGLFPSAIPNTQIDSETHAEEGRAPSVVKHFIMPEGYRLTVPKETHYALFKANPGTYQNPDLVYTIVTFFHDPVDNVTLSLAYETTGFIPEDGQKTFDRDTYNKLYNPSLGGKLEDLPLSDGVTPIAKPSSANQKLDMFLGVLSGTYDNQMSINRYMKVAWENLVDPNQKLIVTSSR